MDYVAHIVYIIMLILQTRGHSPQHNTSNNNSDNSVISSGNSTAIQSETLATTQAGQGYGDVPENNTSSALSPVTGQTTTGSSKSHLFTSVTIPNTHKPKLLNKTSIDGCENCIVGNNGTEITISCLFNGTNKPSVYLGGLEKPLKKPQDKMPGGIWKYLLPAHKTAQYHNDTIICNVTDPSTNTTLEDTARFYAKNSTETNNTGVQHTPHGSTGGVTLDDTSSASPTSMTTTFPSKAHTSLPDRWETKQWLVPLTIVATIVGAVIVMVVIAFFISLTQSRASKQQGPLVNGVLQLGNNAVQERYEMNADEEDGPHDTAVYANVPAELTNAPNTQSSHTASLALGPDTACNALDPDTACNALYLTKN